MTMTIIQGAHFTKSDIQWGPVKQLHLCDITDAEDTDATASNTMTMTDRVTQTDPAEKQPGMHNYIGFMI